ncbi:MAG: prolipoprotein diacylglyceryl transferase [Candidatus Omnitrophica bacterium]|nr:prolipoprotein diacylglyceryl transferase [Candidatus Omnitrophota bacterium]
MHPILFTLGPITIYSYGVAMALAFLIAMTLAAHDARTSLKGLVPLHDATLLDWGAFVMIGGVVGGRLLYVLLNWDSYRTSPLEIFALWHGGLVWYGGLAGGILAQALFAARRHLSFLRITDQVAPVVALGHAIGRLGCFANGCCYGKPTTAWWGVVFPDHLDAVIPTQVIESVGLMILFLVLRMLQGKIGDTNNLQRPGRLFGWYLVGYGLLRAGIESWRGDQPTVWAGMTLAQLISLGLVMTGLLRGHKQIKMGDTNRFLKLFVSPF